MALPNPGMSVTSNTPALASDINDIIENVEALAAGTGQGDDTVTSNKVDYSTFPRFFAYKSGAAQAINTTTAVVAMQTAVYNIGAGYDGSTGKFTVPTGRGGVYNFSCAGGFGNAGSIRATFILRVNGSTSYVGTAVENTFVRGMVSLDILLSAGDYVEFIITTSGTASTSTGIGNVYMTGHLVALT